VLEKPGISCEKGKSQSEKNPQRDEPVVRHVEFRLKKPSYLSLPAQRESAIFHGPVRISMAPKRVSRPLSFPLTKLQEIFIATL
jgi:hypothetical protein